jgi:hypothetical protein
MPHTRSSAGGRESLPYKSLYPGSRRDDMI